MTLHIADDLGSLLQSGNRPAADTARELIVLELYREGRISTGRATELLHESLEEFLKRTARLGIPYFDRTPEEFERELEEVNRLTLACRR